MVIADTVYSGGDIDYRINKAKLQERERIVKILIENYPAISTWKCWKEIEED